MVVFVCKIRDLERPLRASKTRVREMKVPGVREESMGLRPVAALKVDDEHMFHRRKSFGSIHEACMKGGTVVFVTQPMLRSNFSNSLPKVFNTLEDGKDQETYIVSCQREYIYLRIIDDELTVRGRTLCIEHAFGVIPRQHA